MPTFLPAWFRVWRRARWPLVLGVAVLAVGAVAALTWKGRHWLTRPPEVASLDKSEEWILQLTPELRRLAKDLMNLSLPGQAGRGLFAERVEVVDLNPGHSSEIHLEREHLAIETAYWPVAKQPVRVANADLNLWRPLLEAVEYFEHAKVYFVRGTIDPVDPRRATADLGFEAAGKLRDGRSCWFKGTMIAQWIRVVDDEQESARGWRINRFALGQLKTMSTPRPLFREVLAQVVPDAAAQERARFSVMDELFIRLIRDQNYEERGPGYFKAMQWHPAVTVVDLDRDGFDDWYVVERWGKAMFFHNQGNGTFVERAAELGLDIEHFGTCALFADYDNDGDDDLILGRSLRPSLYLVNEGGKFVDRTAERVAEGMPALACALAAADFNRDGWLDVYLSTYAFKIAQEELDGLSWFSKREILAEYLGHDVARQMVEHAPEHHRVLDRLGPPNVLLVGTGQGRLARSPLSDQLAVWRNTFQATWCDYDADGDPDLYVANDYAPNNLFRNEGGQAFVDVTEESDTADVGFGMGASWGDYDCDGRFDLYVSNMFSKAGRRITAKIPDLDPRFSLMARGNSLFHNDDGGRFRKVSGLEPPAMLVESAGWSWSGQFVDLDNDAYLDVYALSGNVTVPDAIAFDVDL